MFLKHREDTNVTYNPKRPLDPNIPSLLPVNCLLIVWLSHLMHLCHVNIQNGGHRRNKWSLIALFNSCCHCEMNGVLLKLDY